MRTLLAIAALLTGLVLWTGLAVAHDAHRMADKPIVSAEKAVPPGPRICLFSQNGKRAEPAPSDSTDSVEAPRDVADQTAKDDANQEASAVPAKRDIAQSEPDPDTNGEASQQASRETSDRVCDTDVTAPVAPHG